LRGAAANVINQQFNFDNLAERFMEARKERGLPIPGQPTSD